MENYTFYLELFSVLSSSVAMIFFMLFLQKRDEVKELKNEAEKVNEYNLEIIAELKKRLEIVIFEPESEAAKMYKYSMAFERGLHELAFKGDPDNEGKEFKGIYNQNSEDAAPCKD